MGQVETATGAGRRDESSLKNSDSFAVSPTLCSGRDGRSSGEIWGPMNLFLASGHCVGPTSCACPLGLVAVALRPSWGGWSRKRGVVGMDRGSGSGNSAPGKAGSWRGVVVTEVDVDGGAEDVPVDSLPSGWLRSRFLSLQTRTQRHTEHQGAWRQMQNADVQPQAYIFLSFLLCLCSL